MNAAVRPKQKGIQLLWQALLAALPLTGVLLACQALMEGVPFWPSPAVGVLALVLCALCSRLTAFPGSVLPALAALGLFLLDPGASVRGAAGFVNSLISGWNRLHEDGVPLLQVSASGRDLELFLLVLASAGAALLWLLLQQRLASAVGIFCLLWIALMFLTGKVSLPSCALLLMGGLCGRMHRQDPAVSPQKILWAGGLLLLLLAGSVVIPTGPVTQLDAVRESTRTAAHALRYGRSTLPGGDLYRSHTLMESDEPVMKVTSAYQKTLYLRGYTGGRYSSGVWEPLPGAAYGGGRAGMLDWLTEHGCPPFSQYAAYRKAGGEMTGNTVSVENFGTERCFVYLPYGAELNADDSSFFRWREEFRAAGILGAGYYTFTEYSHLLPGELLQSDGWLCAPENAQQKQYAEAEAVYRGFVYDQYTKVDDGLSDLIRRLFHGSGTSELTSAYAVTDHIRTVLRERAVYEELPDAVPEGEDPIQWFLTESRRGGAALFASAAVEAYRSFGIPARYAEGYLLKEQQLRLSEDGSVTLTGKDGHVWAEIYMDGMGWVPVDVTPGFYYDVYALQQMMENPGAIHQTAARQEDGDSAGQLLREKQPLLSGIADRIPWKGIGRVLLTGTLILAGLFSLCVCVLELLRSRREASLRKRYEAASAPERSDLLCGLMTRLLTAADPESRPGQRTAWQISAGQEDCVLSEDECVRANELLEKVFYGEEALEPHEQRTMQALLRKSCEALRRRGLRQRIWLRYWICGIK